MLDLYDEDKSSWIKKCCNISHTVVHIKAQGQVFLCYCADWVKEPWLKDITQIPNRDEFWKQYASNRFKNSIKDFSHRYCKGQVCFPLQELYYKGASKDFVKLEDLAPPNQVKKLMLSLDNSCNLTCPTCRTKLIINRGEKHDAHVKKMLAKIDEIFFDPLLVDTIWMDGSGEFSTSTLVLDWMMEKVKTSNVRFELISNGTLLYKNRELIKQILQKTDCIEISIDATNKETFEKIRVGGDWDNLLKGLELVKECKDVYNFKTFSNYVVSNNNVEDFPNFVEFAKQQGLGHVVFSRVRRLKHMTDAQWAEFNVFDNDHPNHNLLQDSIKKVNFDDPYISCNFRDIVDRNILHDTKI